MHTPVDAILAACRPYAQRSALGLPDLITLSRAITLSDADIDALSLSDPAHPYGRRVLMANAQLEVMVATWTPGFPCAPHDHGGQLGAVRVLRGASDHKIWRIAGGKATVLKEHIAGRDEVLGCGPEMVHSMGCAGHGEPLVTLHLYTRSIPHMIVYDLPRNETAIVNGYCGAWIPAADSGQLVATLPGIWDRAAVSAWMAARSAGGPADG